MEINQSFSKLASRGWRMERSILDHRSGRHFRFTGLATFGVQNRDLRYEEVGRLRYGCGTSNAHRRYPLSREHGRVTVRFPDGGYFFDLDPTCLPMTRMRHACGEDIYEGVIAVSKSSWSISWVVRGPQKDYVLDTTYVPSRKALDQLRSNSET